MPGILTACILNVWAVADAAPELQDAATLVTKKEGGQGAVREICEVILKAKKKWPDLVGN